MSKKHPQPAQHDATPSQINTLLGDLLKAKGYEETAPEPAPAVPVKKDASIDLSKEEKLVVRREKKGRGGKTVTLINGFNLPTAKLEEIARAMRKGLGCGSTVERGVIVVQGDIQARVKDWLEKHGAKRIVLGN